MSPAIAARGSIGRHGSSVICFIARSFKANLPGKPLEVIGANPSVLKACIRKISAILWIN